MIQSASQLTERERNFIKAFAPNPEMSACNKWLAERLDTSPQGVCSIALRLIDHRLVSKEYTRNGWYGYKLTQDGRNIYNQLKEEK